MLEVSLNYAALLVLGIMLLQNIDHELLFLWIPLSCYVDIAHRLEVVRIMLQKLDCNVFMLSYRGYNALSL